MKRKMTIKEAVRRSIANFLKEDANSKVVNDFTRREREKRKKFEADSKDEPLRGAEADEDDPYTKFRKRIKRH